jgi:hypothetical protein
MQFEQVDRKQAAHIYPHDTVSPLLLQIHQTRNLLPALSTSAAAMEKQNGGLEGNEPTTQQALTFGRRLCA